MRTRTYVRHAVLVLVCGVSLTPLAWGQKPDTAQDQKEEMKVTVSGKMEIEPVFRDTNLVSVRGREDSKGASVVVPSGIKKTFGIAPLPQVQPGEAPESVVDDLEPPAIGTATGIAPTPDDTPLIKDMPHHGHIRDTPYEGYWIVNTGDVPVEVSFIDKDGARTVIPEFRPGLGTGIPLNATNISLQPVGEGNFGAKIEKTDETTVMQLNTPGTYAVPEVPLQPAAPAVSAFDPFDVLQSGSGVFGGGARPDAREIQASDGAPSRVEHPEESHDQ